MLCRFYPKNAGSKMNSFIGILVTRIGIHERNILKCYRYNNIPRHKISIENVLQIQVEQARNLAYGPKLTLSVKFGHSCKDQHFKTRVLFPNTT